MGYYSKVAIRCDEKTYKDIMEAINKSSYPRNPNSIMKDAYNNYMLIWDWNKWYDEHDEVKAIMNVINNLPEDRSYAYTRIGEESGDIEYRASDDEDYVYANQEFDTWGFKPVDGSTYGNFFEEARYNLSVEEITGALGNILDKGVNRDNLSFNESVEVSNDIRTLQKVYDMAIKYVS